MNDREKESPIDCHPFKAAWMLIWHTYRPKGETTID